MKIEVLYFSGCSNRAPAVERVREALRDEGLSAEIVETEVADTESAQQVKFLGSPTIRVDSLDIEREARSATEFGLMCRTYAVGSCRTGLPSRELVLAALREARGAITGPGREEPTSANTNSGTVAASFAAIGSVLAASICCLPLFPFMMAAGLAGTSAFLSEVRPYFLVGSVLFIALAFYQARRARKCNRRTSIVASALLWVSAAFVLISIFFPQMMANAIAGR